MIKAVLIDFGNTLMRQRTEETELFDRGVRNLAKYLRKKGYKPSFKKLKQVEAELRDEASRFRDKTSIEVDAADRMAVLLNTVGVHVSPKDELTGEAVLAFYKPIIDDMTIYQDSVEFLRTLKKDGYKLALVSNAASDIAVMKAAKQLGVAKFFNKMVVSSQIGVRKPSSAVYMEALNALKVNPREAVFIGDLIGTDITGAKRLGMKTILKINESPGVETNFPDAVVTSLKDAIKIIAKWNKS